MNAPRQRERDARSDGLRVRPGKGQPALLRDVGRERDVLRTPRRLERREREVGEGEGRADAGAARCALGAVGLGASLRVAGPREREGGEAGRPGLEHRRAEDAEVGTRSPEHGRRVLVSAVCQRVSERETRERAAPAIALALGGREGGCGLPARAGVADPEHGTGEPGEPGLSEPICELGGVARGLVPVVRAPREQQRSGESGRRDGLDHRRGVRRSARVLEPRRGLAQPAVEQEAEAGGTVALGPVQGTLAPRGRRGITQRRRADDARRSCPAGASGSRKRTSAWRSRRASSAPVGVPNAVSASL